MVSLASKIEKKLDDYEDNNTRVILILLTTETFLYLSQVAYMHFGGGRTFLGTRFVVTDSIKDEFEIITQDS